MTRVHRVLTSLVVIIFICFSLPIKAQQTDLWLKLVNDIPSELPRNLTLKEDGPQQYQMTTLWHNRDIRGKATAKFVVSGKYTRGLPTDTVRWNDIRIEVFSDPESNQCDTIRVESLEGLTYKTPDDIANPELFRDFPTNESRHLLQTLVWDAVGIEVFGWTYFDRLELNQPVRAVEFEDFEAGMAGWGTFKMKNLMLTWTGVSRLNGEPCAVVSYESLANPVNAAPGIMAASGRSCYWGLIYISLTDKQIEFGTMNEDVIIEMPSPSGSKTLNMQREFRMEKID